VRVLRTAALVVAFFLVAACGYVASARWALRDPVADGLARVHGRVEGERVPVACEYAGRLKELRVREGEEVAAGQILAVFDETQARSRLARSHEAVKAAEAQARATRAALELLEREVPIEIEAAEAAVALARATVGRAESATRLAGVPAELLNSDLEVARASLARSEKQLEQIRLGRDRIRVKAEEVSALEAQVQLTRAALSEAETALTGLTVRAPSSGVVVSRIAGPGQVLPEGSRLLELVDLDALYLLGSVRSAQGAVPLAGAPALVWAAGPGSRPVRATARPSSIDRESRIDSGDQVPIVIELGENPDHALTPGQAAVVVVRIRSDAPWPPLNPLSGPRPGR
jgi:HlyD family secretion protein